MTSIVASPRELVVVIRDDSALKVTPGHLITASDKEQLEQLTTVLSREHATLTPLFGVRGDVLEKHMSKKPELFANPALNLSLYYRIIAPDEKLESLAEQLLKCRLVDSAYVKPGAEPAIFDTQIEGTLELDSADKPLSLEACDFRDDQEYLGSDENGINITAAQPLEGGYGGGIDVIDIEGAWCFSHSDLKENQGEMVGGVAIDDPVWRNHGTAVLGVLGADVNDFGITGICPQAGLRTSSIFGWPCLGVAPTWASGAAIRQAADVLKAGDVLILELHFPGPEARFKANDQQHGYLPAEWWPDCAAAIMYAISLDIVVVAAAGNGAVDLNASIYNENPESNNTLFPTGWDNPLHRTRIDTGSILVGAGAPRTGIHVDNWGPTRSRLPFSNHGLMVDAQAWGRDVTSTGFGKLCRVEEDFYYTRHFNGTSSATAIVAGAVTCIQGIRKAANQAPLSSKQVRQILRETGSPQQDFPGTPDSAPRPSSERIGNLPNLQQMIEKMNEF